MTLAPTRAFAANQQGAFTPPSFAGLSAFTFELWFKPSSLVNGHIVRIGSPTDGATHKMRLRMTSAGALQLDRTVGTATQSSVSAAAVLASGTWAHIVAVFPTNADHALYVNGANQTLTHTGSALNGALSIASTDELAIGDPSPSSITGAPGDYGRVTLWPFAMGAQRVAVSYRHQTDFTRWVGSGSENRISDTNLSPVAVPLRATATAGTAATIDVRPTAYDPNSGDTLSVVAGSASVVSGSGSVTITSGNLVFTPSSSFTGEAVLGYRLQDTAGKQSTGRVYVTVSSAPVTSDLFNNPFNKDSVHHRPIGAGYQLGIAPGLLVNTTNNKGGGIPYDTPANKALVDAAMDRIGRWIFSTGAATFKYFHRINAGTTNTRKVGWRGNRLPCSSGGGNGFGSAPRTTLVTVTMPAPGTTYDSYTVAYPPSNLTGTPNAGDNSVLLWPKNGDATRDVAVLFNEFRYSADGTDYTVGARVGSCSDNVTRAAPTGQEAEARFIQEYPLSGTDIGDGSGASEIKSPSMYLRAIDMDGGSGSDPDPGPIYHALQLVGTRDAGPNDGDPTPSSAHLLGKRRCWPSSNYDGGSGGAGNSNANLGPFPYGQRFFIPPTAANKALRNDTDLCRSNRQKRLFDCLMYYGMVLVDGHGQYFQVGTVKKGEFRIRCDNLLPTAVQSELISFMARLHAKKVIMPLYNPRDIPGEPETERYNNPGQPGHGICFAGGGGPIDANSVNNAIA